MMKRGPALAYQHIEWNVRKAQRDLMRPVYPWEVQARMLYPRAEGSLRRDMMAMAAQGRLVRVGGVNARRGYRVPTAMERLCWSINGGMWPVGTERVFA